MAKVVNSMPPRSRGRSFLYPWDDWLNGQVWELRQGVDFQTATYSFVTYVLKIIRVRGLPLRVSRNKDVVWIGPAGGNAAG